MREKPARRSRLMTRPVSLLALLLVASSVFAPNALATLHNEIGALIVQQPCCSGAALQGVRSHILLPTNISVPTKKEVLVSVAAQDDVLQPGQIGIKYSNNLVVHAGTACEQPYNTFIGFYEWWDYVNSVTQCKSLGAVTAGHLYSVVEQSNGKWQVFVDGNPQLSSPLIQMHASYQPNASRVSAGGEVVWDASVSGPEPVSWTGGFAGNGNTPWQRYNFSTGWTTISSNNAICNGDPASCSGGSWTFSTSSFPTSWSVNH